ncbi:MAG: hypothetical protein KF779_15690 [Hyphomonadaceae bacterium]|nr:hypothetical protein [Hyphomonadaceae bacterium]
MLWLSERIAAKRIAAFSRVNSVLSVFNFVKAVDAFVLLETPLPRLKVGTPAEPLLDVHQVAPIENEEEVGKDERVVSHAFGRLIGIDRLAPDIIAEDFFDHNASKACFVVYRRAAAGNDILKGFLVVQPPKTGVDDAFSFNHYYSDGIGNDRETRGFIISLAHRYYFIGASGKMGKRKRDGSSSRPLLNEGMKFLVLDRKMQAQQGSMWGGLFLSHDRLFTPIAGRCVLIRSKFEHSQDVHVGPVVGELQKDIQTNCDVPGPLEKHMAGILLAIDNSYEPLVTCGGDQKLMGPLTITPPIA